jgi:signal-transduction protein with cAMP-binding, CBS, and nucleotidyltransferase domain
LLDLADALAIAAEGLLRQIDRLSHEGTLSGLKAVKVAEVELAEAMFADNLPATEIQQVLTRINNDIYRRIGEAALHEMAAAGWGELPRNAATIVMGSGGRGENFLMPDQDNGFIIADYADAEHPQIDAFFLELAERMCRDLNAVGIRYCNGYCMAINPLWRKTLSQWKAQIALWVRKSNFVSIRLSDIFFDFQPVWGKADLAEDLRRAVTDLVRGNPVFLRQMFQETTEQPAALGFFGGFVTEREDHAHRGEMNLKVKGVLPLVSAVRLLALRQGSEETATLARIAALAAAGILERPEAEDLTAAFALLTDVLLRRQIADFKAGREASYFIDPQQLTKRRRGELHDALRAIDALRKRVDYEFTAQLF